MNPQARQIGTHIGAALIGAAVTAGVFTLADPGQKMDSPTPSASHDDASKTVESSINQVLEAWSSGDESKLKPLLCGVAASHGLGEDAMTQGAAESKELGKPFFVMGKSAIENDRAIVLGQPTHEFQRKAASPVIIEMQKQDGQWKLCSAVNIVSSGP